MLNPEVACLDESTLVPNVNPEVACIIKSSLVPNFES